MGRKKQQAQELLKKIKDLGHEVSIEGNFVVFKPPLPVDILIETTSLSKELYEITYQGKFK